MYACERNLFEPTRAILQAAAVAKQVVSGQGVEIPYMFGTMIEVPRGALVADQLVEMAQFFSFGTNDLTQMTFGFSRDDAGKFLVPYVEKKILPTDPFETLDRGAQPATGPTAGGGRVDAGAG